MNKITEHIKARRSVRTFDGQDLKEKDREILVSFMETVENPFHIPVEFKWMDAKEYGLTCPVVVGTICMWAVKSTIAPTQPLPSDTPLKCWC